MSSLFAELKRRNVLRAAALYAAAGWLLVQVATQVFPFFGVPNGAVRAVVIAVAIGFPFALLISWFYELTPEGLKRESEIDHSQSITRQAGHRLDRIFIGALALAVLLLLADRFRPHAVPAAAGAEKSIAVLPFANLSDDKANAYFADGMQDEILTRLAKIGALKVISRSSTAGYPASPGNLSDIARELGVANILEGSVQKIGNSVHINVQLIRASTREHLWAESYNRTLDDIFGVEGEVAGAIAEALNTRLSGAEQQAMAMPPTRNPAAYDAYLRGLALMQRDGDPEQRRALSYFEQAVQLDPGFALAWARLAIVRSFLYFNFMDRTPQQLERMKADAETALKLAPELGEAWLALGYYRYRGLRDYEGGLAAFENARERLPNNADVLASISFIERRQGKWATATERLQQAVQLAPQNASYWRGLSFDHQALRNYPQALAALDHALDIDPGNPDTLAGRALVYQLEGRLDEAGKVLDAFAPDPKYTEAFLIRLQQFLYQRRYDAVIETLLPVVGRSDALAAEFAINLSCILGYAWKLKGDEAAARTSFSECLRTGRTRRSSDADDALLTAYYAFANAGLGNKDEALRQARRHVELNAPDAVARPGAEINQAQVLVLVGETEAAIASLPRLLETPGGVSLADLRFNPAWDGIREDPRFRKLVAEPPR